MRDSLKMAFYSQRHTAIHTRNVIWELTFDQWLEIWNNSGYLHLRGRGKGKYCMARKNDQGPYSIDNVYIQRFEENNKDQHKWNPRFDNQREIIKIKDPMGNILEYPNLKTASRQLNLSYDMLWQRKNKSKKYKGYEFVC